MRFWGTLLSFRKQTPAPIGVVAAWGCNKERTQQKRKQTALLLSPARTPSAPGRARPNPGRSLQSSCSAGRARAEGWETAQSQRLLVLKLSSIFCRHQPRGSSNAIGGKTELFGECWTPHYESSRGGGWF